MPPGSVLTGRPVACREAGPRNVSGPAGHPLAQPIVSNGVGSLIFDTAFNAPGSDLRHRCDGSGNLQRPAPL